MNFLETIYQNLHQLEDRPILREIHDQQSVDISAADLALQLRRARTFIAAQGICPGERVALLAPNSARWIAIELAILAEGAIVVPLYSRQSPQELAKMLADCQPQLLLIGDATLEQAIRAAWSTPSAIALVDDVFGAEPTQAEPYPISAHAVIALLYTSGTSGSPKGVMLTRANFDYMIPLVSQLLEAITQPSSSSGGAFHCLPFCFAPAHLILWAQLYQGRLLTLSTQLDNLAVDLRCAAPSFFLTVPLVLERFRSGIEQALKQRGPIPQWLFAVGQRAYGHSLTGNPWIDAPIFRGIRATLLAQIKRAIAPSLQLIICGSAPLRVETQRWFTMLGIPVYQGYGLTETTGLVTLERLQRQVPGYVGHAIEGCEVRLTRQGELVCQGPNIFAGYWNNPAATAQVMDNGWFHTGDRAEVSASGNWRLVGRLKHLLVPTSGHNIAPEPLEQRLIDACQGVEHAMVVGHGRPFLSAILSGSADESALETAIERFNATVPHYQKIRKFYYTRKPFSQVNGLLTANGKLRRTAIEAHFQAAIDCLYQTTPDRSTPNHFTPGGIS